MKKYTNDELRELALSGEKRNELRAAITQARSKLSPDALRGLPTVRELTKTVDLLSAAQTLDIDLAAYATPGGRAKGRGDKVVSVPDIPSKPVPTDVESAASALDDALEKRDLLQKQRDALPDGMPDDVVQTMATKLNDAQALVDACNEALEKAHAHAKAKAYAEKALQSPPSTGEIEFVAVGKLLKLRHKSLKGVFLPVFKGKAHEKVPAVDKDFYFNYEDGEIIRDIAISLGAVYEKDRRKHVQSNLWLWGAKGAGKSELVAQIAARCNRPMFVTSCHRELTVESLTGDFDPRSVAQGENAPALLNPSFIQGIQTPHAIVVLDETGRINPVNAVGLNGMLERRQATRQDGDTVDFAEGVNIVSTCNSNGTGDPSGLFECFPQDQSILDRFRAFVRLPFLPADQETAVLVQKSGLVQPVAELIVKVMNAFRGASDGTDASVQARGLYPSLRGAGNLAERLIKGVPFRRAVATCLTGNVTLPDVDIAAVIVDAHSPSDSEISDVVSGKLVDFIVEEEPSSESKEESTGGADTEG